MPHTVAKNNVWFYSPPFFYLWMFLNIVSIIYLEILHSFLSFLRKEIRATLVSNALKNVLMATEYGPEDVPSCLRFPVVGLGKVFFFSQL